MKDVYLGANCRRCQKRETFRIRRLLGNPFPFSDATRFPLV